MLGFEEMRRLRVCLEDKLQVDEGDSFNVLMWRTFVDRCVREYFAKWRKGGSSELHVNRESLAKGSVIGVLSQVRPTDNVPLGGDVEQLVVKIQPFLEVAFDMPGPKRAPANTPEARVAKCQADIKAGVYDFAMISQHDELMQAFVTKKMTEHSKRNGYPLLEGTLPGPYDVYELSSTRVGVRRSKKPCSPFSFLRHGAAYNAVLRMKNNNKTVVRVSAKNSPTARDWTNAAPILWEFLAHYNSEEGVSQTSKLLQPLTNYVFYGEFNVVVKKQVVGQKKFLSGLHFKLTNGRTRYQKNCLQYFDTFASLYEHNPLWKTFFDDMGAGSPPVSYLAGIEEGLRNYACDPYPMGRDAMRSQEKWASVDLWRKREAYVTLIRLLLSRNSYHKWHDFLFTDFAERNKLHTTFKNRHLPLSDGDSTNFGGLIKNPPHWTEPIPPPKHKVARTAARKPNLKAVKKEQVQESKSVPMRFDSKSGTLVEFIEIE